MSEKTIKRRHLITKIILIVIGFVAIPLYSYFFGNNGDLFLMTFSQVGGRLDGKLEGLILWGFLCSVYFYFVFEYMQMMIEKSSMLVKLFLFAGVITLMVTVFLPFNTMMYPVSSEIHNNLARYAIFFILISIFLFVILLIKFDKKVFAWAISIFSVFVGGLIWCFLKYRVSSIFQIAFASSMSVLAMIIFFLIERSPKFDLYRAYGKKYKNFKENNLENSLERENEEVFNDEIK